MSDIRYTLGIDPEANEILVADSRSHEVLLRGPASSREAIQELVNLANRPSQEAPHGYCHD